jgi:hypothetical protein
LRRIPILRLYLADSAADHAIPYLDPPARRWQPGQETDYDRQARARRDGGQWFVGKCDGCRHRRGILGESARWSRGRAHEQMALGGLDRLDVMHAATVPIGTELRAARYGEMLEQLGHRVVRTMRGDQIIALESGLPFALAAGDQDRLSWLVGQPIERALDISLLRRFGLRVRGSASTSAHQSSVVGSCGCDQERRPTASRACAMAVTSLPTSGRVASSKTKFGGIANTCLPTSSYPSLSTSAVQAQTRAAIQPTIVHPNRMLRIPIANLLRW